MKKNVWLYLVFTFVLTYGAVFGLPITTIYNFFLFVNV